MFSSEFQVRKYIRSFKILCFSASCEDPIPAALINSAINRLLCLYVDLVNKSLAEGTIEGIAHSEIDPLLKNEFDPDKNKTKYTMDPGIYFLMKTNK